MNIRQKPLFSVIPVYQPIIFVVEDDQLTATKFNVKFIAKVRVAKTNVAQQQHVVTLKVSPNGRGKGIFDFSKVLQSYVTSDNLGGKVSDAHNKFSTFKSNPFNDLEHPIHVIDQFATNQNTVRLLQIEFGIQYSNAENDAPQIDDSVVKQSDEFIIYNGTLQEDDVLQTINDDFGYNLDIFNYIANDDNAKFLTDCPTTLEIGLNDYHTVAFFNNLEGDFNTAGSGASNTHVRRIQINFYDGLDGTGSIVHTKNIVNLPTFGGIGVSHQNSNSKLVFSGVGTANIKQHFTTTSTFKSYKIQAQDDNDDPITQSYTFNIVENDCKGFEKLRLTWLNRHGAWDYFNFTKKNIRTVNTTRKNFQQLKGTWNEDNFKLRGYKGGTKTFRTNSKETISLNTDFITEETAIWLEQLFTSPEVYILSEHETLDTGGIGRKYVTPVVIKSQTYTRQTKANDKLIQYSLEIEMSKNKVIQHA
ncbi:MAG: hypothetical protein CML17_03680 [Pusillimonas sp.]|nr:hypothetical protein [Pusillimonas sp.]